MGYPLLDENLGRLFFWGLFALIFVMLCYWIICLWEHKKSFYIGPITRTPVVPFSQDKFKEYRGRRGERIFYEPSLIEENASMKVLERIMKYVYGDKSKFKYLDEARIISIKMDGFEHGKLCHHFVPIDGMTDGSYYTYQVFGDIVVQVTRFVEDGVGYVAGFCIYIRDYETLGVAIPEDVIRDFFMTPKLPKKPQKLKSRMKRMEETQSTNHLHPEPLIPNTNWTVSFCSKLHREVMTTRDSEGVVHQEWDPAFQKMIGYRCQECSRRLDLPPAYSTLYLG